MIDSVLQLLSILQDSVCKQCGILQLHSNCITKGLLHTSVNQTRVATSGGLDHWYTD
jgi:hypothetical protein